MFLSLYFLFYSLCLSSTHMSLCLSVIDHRSIVYITAGYVTSTLQKFVPLIFAQYVPYKYEIYWFQEYWILLSRHYSVWLIVTPRVF